MSNDKVYSQDPVVFITKNEDNDVAQIFVESLIQNIKDIYQQFKFPKRMIFTKDDAKRYVAATTCHICERELSGKDKVCDHCHITGKFRGAAHNRWNLNFKVPKFFPVIFHNFSGYDSLLFIKKLRGDNSENIKCISNNEEKYISFSRDVVVDKFVNKKGKEVLVKQELWFIDSFRFMAASLDTLMKNLYKDQCKELTKMCKQFDLLMRKEFIRMIMWILLKS